MLPQDGYVTAYVGNASDVDVLFDDVTVEHRQGLQVQETQYDPFGLSLAGVDYSTPSIKALNQYQFNGKERQLDLGLGWSDYGTRFYDPARGSGWMSPDPLADKMRRWSPYAFSFDNPMRFVDPDGMEAEDAQGGPHNRPIIPAALRMLWVQVSHPLEAAAIGEYNNMSTNISSNATRFAMIGASDAKEDKSILSVGDGGGINAFRHTLWSATITSRFGAEDAKDITDAHEDNPDTDLSQRLFSGKDAKLYADMHADLLNNEIGRSIGSASQNQGMNTIAGKVVSRFVTTGLWKVSAGTKQEDGTYSYSISLQKITSGQNSALQARLKQLKYPLVNSLCYTD